ncbi:MAG: DNA polymerase IV [Clostridia bacterium]|nr:DNA polymerase IV [Clostridia bacterium]
MENLSQKYVNKQGINEGRIVLHSDLNNFFASVECKKRPELKGLPVAVCGSREDRHGIVLAKNELAKKCGVKTAEAIWQAKLKCPSLVIVPPNYDEYVRYSRMVKEIYYSYTDLIEGFGMDEAWIELTGDRKVKTLEQGACIADEIRKRVKKETGLTVSVGVSDNKIFAKLASDYKKPDAVTVFGPHNYDEVVKKLDVGELLFVGRSTRAKLHLYGINTIGELVGTNGFFMKSMLGKNGESLYRDACGANSAKVSRWGESDEAKSIGNSVTLPRDLDNIDEVHSVFCALAEKVAYRLRSAGFAAKTVCISVRSTGLVTTEKQMHVELTSNAVEIADAATRLYIENYNVNKPVRSVGIRTTNLISKNIGVQLELFDKSYLKREKLAKIDNTVDEIRGRYGVDSITHVSAMKVDVIRHNATSFAHGF